MHLERSGAEHRALPVQRGRGPLHHHVRPPVLAHVALGHRRRRPDERPADRLHRRLPEVDPAARRSRPAGSTRSARAAPAASGRPEGHRRRAEPTGAPRATARLLFNLDPRVGAYSCARCHTNGWSYGQPARVGRRRARTEPDRGLRGTCSSRTPTDSSPSCTIGSGPGQAATASRARAPGRMPGFGAIYYRPDRGGR